MLFQKEKACINSSFDAIRKYIRYGEWSDDLWFKYAKGSVSTVKMPNDAAHFVGYMWFPENGQWILCGCLTWFGELTYIFKLGKTGHKVQNLKMLDSTKKACFNNGNRTIIGDDAVHIYGSRPGSE